MGVSHDMWNSKTRDTFNSMIQVEGDIEQLREFSNALLNLLDKCVDLANSADELIKQQTKVINTQRSVNTNLREQVAAYAHFVEGIQSLT